MGMAKDLLMQMEEDEIVATEIAIESEVMERCSDCGDVFDACAGGNEAAHELMIALIDKRDDRVEDFFNDPKRGIEAIDRAVENAGIECTCGSQGLDDDEV